MFGPKHIREAAIPASAIGHPAPNENDGQAAASTAMQVGGPVETAGLSEPLSSGVGVQARVLHDIEDAIAFVALLKPTLPDWSISFGYIGNLEPWGDDRSWRILARPKTCEGPWTSKDTFVVGETEPFSLDLDRFECWLSDRIQRQATHFVGKDGVSIHVGDSCTTRSGATYTLGKIVIGENSLFAWKGEQSGGLLCDVNGVAYGPTISHAKDVYDRSFAGESIVRPAGTATAPEGAMVGTEKECSAEEGGAKGPQLPSLWARDLKNQTETITRLENQAGGRPSAALDSARLAYADSVIHYAAIMADLAAQEPSTEGMAGAVVSMRDFLRLAMKKTAPDLADSKRNE